MKPILQRQAFADKKGPGRQTPRRWGWGTPLKKRPVVAVGISSGTILSSYAYVAQSWSIFALADVAVRNRAQIEENLEIAARNAVVS